eukprot:INCI16155.4.p1 GENE.INCI16155.4~~INCI16155.4.p1  ORF type:complete len:288 (-),score=57.69 INCI16155.4:145-1008(-)
MEQRRRRSFFGGDSASGAGSPLPMLSPGGHRHRKRGSWGRIAIGLAALLLLAGGVYYFMLAGRPVVEDHAASLKKIEQMTPEELQAHREERMALHREKMSKRASRAGDRAGDRADRASRAKERERAQEQRRQRRARGRATGDGHGHPVEDGPDASELPAKAHQPEGKFGDGQEAGKPTPGSSRMPPPGGKKEPPAKPPRRGRGSAEGTMPGSPEDLKARKAENAKRKAENDREMERRRQDLEERKALYNDEVASRKAGAVAKGKEAAAARAAARQAALEKNKPKASR